MRLALLYATSRQVPTAVLGVLVATGVLWALTAVTGGGPAMIAFALLVDAAVLAPGLTGHDVHLDRTAAIRWYPRRIAHLLLIAVVAGGVVLSWQALGDRWAPPAFVARDVAGLVGLTGLAATVLGGQLAWTVPLVWFAAGRLDDQDQQVVTWMFQPAGTTAATWTAAVLAVTGTAAYAGFGNRR